MQEAVKDPARSRWLLRFVYVRFDGRCGQKASQAPRSADPCSRFLLRHLSWGRFRERAEVEAEGIQSLCCNFLFSEGPFCNLAPFVCQFVMFSVQKKKNRIPSTPPLRSFLRPQNPIGSRRLPRSPALSTDGGQKISAFPPSLAVSSPATSICWAWHTAATAGRSFPGYLPSVQILKIVAGCGREASSRTTTLLPYASNIPTRGRGLFETHAVVTTENRCFEMTNAQAMDSTVIQVAWSA